MTTGEPSYREAVASLYRLQKYGIKFGLSKTTNLLKAFGNPHKGRKYLHIAGTNGKGSVAAFLSSVLKEAGYRVGLYTSPHVVRFTERFRINDQEISTQKAAVLTKEIRNAFSPQEPPTFFEATTAMALLYFAQENTDIAIMEVGMGGRLDATNIITPLVSIITNISLEHQIYLGNRLLDIAEEKGGIIKQGIDIITGAVQPEVISRLQSIAEKRQAPFWRLGRDIRYRTTGSGLHYYGLERRINDLELGLKGGFQSRNAAIALAALERLEKKGLSVSTPRIRDGLKNVKWSGRMHAVSTNPTLIVDGAHNPAAMRALASAIRQEFTYERLILVIGVMKDKEIGKLLGEIVPISDHVIYTRPVYSRAADPNVLMSTAASMGKPGQVSPILAQALARARELSGPQDLILVCGSLFTAGEALARLDPQNFVADGF
jgi:dihydrofolate synthase/folylpolyglutamate synthase